MNIFYNLIGQATGQAPGLFGGNNLYSTIFMIVAMLAIFYFLLVMPQNRKKKAMEQMLNSMKSGDKVVTIGGIHGKIVSVKDKEIVLKVDANTEITFEKSAISKVLKSETAVEKKDDR